MRGRAARAARAGRVSQQGKKRASDTEESGSDVPGPAVASERRPRNLKFVPVTEEKLQGQHDPQELQSIRRHVMQDFIQQRNTGGSKDKPQASPPDAAPSDLSSHVGRFRVQGQRSKSATRSPAQEPRPRKLLPLQPAGRPTLSRSSTDGQGTPSVSGRSDDSEEMAVTITNNTGRADPFVTLPIEATAEVHALVDYCK